MRLSGTGSSGATVIYYQMSDILEYFTDIKIYATYDYMIIVSQVRLYVDSYESEEENQNSYLDSPQPQKDNEES